MAASAEYWRHWTMESSPDYTLAPGSSGKLPRSRCGLRHSFDCTTDGRRTGEGLEWSHAGRRLVALLSLCSASAHAGRRSAFSKAIIACLWRLETCEAETSKSSTAEQTPPRACTCLTVMPFNDQRGCVVAGTRNMAFAKV